MSPQTETKASVGFKAGLSLSLFVVLDFVGQTFSFVPSMPLITNPKNP
jgi:hypothetical protein